VGPNWRVQSVVNAILKYVFKTFLYLQPLDYNGKGVCPFWGGICSVDTTLFVRTLQCLIRHTATATATAIRGVRTWDTWRGGGGQLLHHNSTATATAAATAVWGGGSFK
jgi:hypothetical protein